jgi:hypothetical protein
MQRVPLYIAVILAVVCVVGYVRRAQIFPRTFGGRAAQLLHPV